MGEKRRDRRRYPRLVANDTTKGRLRGIGETPILNISLQGTQIEHAEIIRPGTVLDLVLPLAGREMRLRCRVVWSAIHRAEMRPDGEQELIFRTGLAFLDLSEKTR